MGQIDDIMAKIGMCDEGTKDGYCVIERSKLRNSIIRYLPVSQNKVDVCKHLDWESYPMPFCKECNTFLVEPVEPQKKAEGCPKCKKHIEETLEDAKKWSEHIRNTYGKPQQEDKKIGLIVERDLLHKGSNGDIYKGLTPTENKINEIILAINKINE